MGFLDGLRGNASSVEKGEVKEELGLMLLPDEEVDQAFKVICDLIVFTDRRLLLVDKQGLTGWKVSYHSIPYASIT